MIDYKYLIKRRSVWQTESHKVAARRSNNDFHMKSRYSQIVCLNVSGLSVVSSRLEIVCDRQKHTIQRLPLMPYCLN